MTSVIFLDIESTINGGTLHGAHPLHPNNKVVLVGWRMLNHHMSPTVVEPDVKLNAEDFYDTMLVGHNLAFDLKYVLKDTDGLVLRQISSSDFCIWDTMVAEYLLEGQDTESGLSLESTCRRHGIPFSKDEEIASKFEAGIGADAIDKAKLTNYLIDDIEVLPLLFSSQVEKITNMGMMPLAKAMMASRKALILAEFHGMKIDTHKLRDIEPVLEKRKAELKKGLLMQATTDKGLIMLDLTSNDQLLKYLYGGTHTTKERKPIGLYKNGKVKYGTEETEHQVFPVMPDGFKLTSVGEESLRDLVVVHGHFKNLVDKVLEYRTVSKELSTYVSGLINRQIDNVIHADINCTITATGRTSSSKPNLQNIKDSPLKGAFVSRFKDGKLLEIDFSQIEIIALAILSHDPMLIHDIKEGNDIHTELYKSMFGRAPTLEQRKQFKRLTFGLIYGSGVNGLARTAGVSSTAASKFKRTFYNRYSVVNAYHKRLADEPIGRAVLVNGKYVYKKQTPTGRVLTYRDALSFSYTKLMNYPVQSLAADIVQYACGDLQHTLASEFGDRALLVNLIHDSFVIDAGYYAEQVASVSAKRLCSTLERMNRDFKIEMPLTELKVSVKMGSDWFNMKPLEV